MGVLGGSPTSRFTSVTVQREERCSAGVGVVVVLLAVGIRSDAVLR